MRQIRFCGSILFTITRGGRRRWSTRWGSLATTTHPWTGKSWKVSRYLLFRELAWWIGGMRWEEYELRECSTGGGVETNWRLRLYSYTWQVTRETSSSRAGQPNIFQYLPISSDFSTGLFGRLLLGTRKEVPPPCCYPMTRGGVGRWKPGRRSPGGLEEWGGCDFWGGFSVLQCNHFHFLSL